jgi:hypothetical protein
MRNYCTCALLLALLPLPAHAGHGTIRETDTAIIIEYEGDANDVKAAKVQEEIEEKNIRFTEEAELEREAATARRIAVESTPEKRAARRAQSEARRRRDAGE